MNTLPEVTTPGRTVFLRGFKTYLRPLEEGDLLNCQRWINDPEVRRFLKNSWPLSFADEKKWIEGKVGNRSHVILAIVTVDGDHHIGNIGLHRINWQNRFATTGTVIGEKDYWGKSYGTDAKMQLLHWAFHEMNLRKICSSVIAYNERSLKYSLHCGYQEEGRLKEHFFREGQYWDEILLAIFRDDFEPVWERYQALATGCVR